jgi:hypothetical protein
MEQGTLLNLDKGNFSINYVDVTKVIYQGVWEDSGTGTDDIATTHPGHILVVCDKNKTRIQHLYEADLTIEKPLAEIFGSMIKIRG